MAGNKTLADLKAEAATKAAQLVQANAPLVSEDSAVQKTKRYYSKIAGSRFIFGNGQEITFFFGRADIGPDMPGGMDIYQHTNPDGKHAVNGLQCWQVYQQELNAILGKQTNIYLPEVMPIDAPNVSQNAKSEAEIAAGEAALKAGSAVKTQQEMGAFQGTGAPTDVNQSTVDPAIRAAMMGNAVDSTNAEALAAQMNAGAAPSAS